MFVLGPMALLRCRAICHRAQKMNGITETGLKRFHADLRQYAAEARIPVSQAIEKKAKDFGFKAMAIARRIAPKKGEITSAARRRGFRVKIRPSVRRKAQNIIGSKGSVKRRIKGGSKRLNLQALGVHMELAQRERSKGYSGLIFQVARRLRPSASGQNVSLQKNNKQSTLGKWRVNTKQKNPEINVISYQPGLAETDKKHRITAQAVRIVSADMGEYFARKQYERLDKIFKPKYA